MKEQTPSHIFKSQWRGCEETDKYKCFSTFSFNQYQDEFKKSFGQLKFFNDEFLSPQQSITHKLEENTQVFLLPLAGALNYYNSADKEELIKYEQLKYFNIEKGSPYTFNNPYEKEWINYLHIGFKSNSSRSEHASYLQGIEFEKMNTLVSLDFKKSTEGPCAGYIGIYESRKKEDYILKDPKNGLFVYVIKGAFDFEGRLLEYRDGLSMWDINEVEFEALTENAIIMLLEVPLDNN